MKNKNPESVPANSFKNNLKDPVAGSSPAPGVIIYSTKNMKYYV